MIFEHLAFILQSQDDVHFRNILLTNKIRPVGLQL
jgi:hypothetical protein